MALHDKVEVACPHCGSSQKEPASALSTYCRNCGGHIKLEKKAPAGRKGGLGGLMNLARGKPPAVPPPPADESAPPKPPSLPAPVRAPSIPLQISGYGEGDAPLTARASLNLHRPRAAGEPVKETRPVVCFECQASHRVAVASTSTICPSCSTYIDLRDLEIKERTTQRIRTRGDVTVHKKGALLGTAVHCGNLTIHGSVSGSIYASGEVCLKADMKILGEIRCRRFVIEKKCEVQCLQPVHAETIEIYGHATGHFYAEGCISLSRHASLQGSASAQTLSVEPGGILNGQVKVLRPEPRPFRGEPALLPPNLAATG